MGRRKRLATNGYDLTVDVRYRLSFPIPTILAAVIGTGCATGPSFLDAAQPDAVRMAEERARSELGCSSATGSVVSRETLATPPPQRVAYVVVVAGCGQRQRYVVGCTDRGGGCYTGAGRPVP